MKFEDLRPEKSLVFAEGSSLFPSIFGENLMIQSF